jgi:glycosyltransferase involved in cell wall biosynthesis
VALVPNAIVLDRFERLPDRVAARRRFGIDLESDVALALGWWPDAKGADLVVAALEQMHRDGTGPVALIVGEDRLERFLARELPHGAPWLRTSRFVEDAAWLYAAADVFVSASRHEGYSYAVGEALACGLPVVLSDIGGTRLFAAAPGVVQFPSGDAAALAAVLGRLLADPGRTALGAANRAWAHAHLAIEPWCERMVELYRGLI